MCPTCVATCNKGGSSYLNSSRNGYACKDTYTHCEPAEPHLCLQPALPAHPALPAQSQELSDAKVSDAKQDHQVQPRCAHPLKDLLLRRRGLGDPLQQALDGGTFAIRDKCGSVTTTASTLRWRLSRRVPFYIFIPSTFSPVTWSACSDPPQF